jgi:hypothetical protein
VSGRVTDDGSVLCAKRFAKIDRRLTKSRND